VQVNPGPASADPPVPSGPSHRPEALPVHLEPLDPRVRILWRLAAGLRGVAWTGAAAPLEAFGRGRPLGEALLPEALPPGWLTGAMAALWILVLIVVPGLRYRRWRYALRTDDLWIRRGILVHRISVIPYSRLQFVDTRQGPLERWFGLTELVVHTAAPGTSGLIPGLRAREAEALRETLARVASRETDGA
jgi:uncharacterized protein